MLLAARGDARGHARHIARYVMVYEYQSRLQAIRIQYTSRIFAPTVEFLVALGTVATPDSRLNGALNLEYLLIVLTMKHDYIIVVESCRHQHAEA